MKAKRTSASGREARPRGPCEAFGAELDRLVASLAPSEEARRHFQNAVIEVMKGLRTLIDDRIPRTSRESPKGTSIPIE
jgi:hypothetical protein